MLVRRAIEAEIADGTLQPGDRIPSERDLAVRFGVSRVTVRRALGELAEKGLIDSQQGRGTFVAARPLGEAPNTLMSFTAMGESRGLVPSAIVLSQRIEPATLADSDDFRIAPGADVFVLERVRMLDDQPVSVDRTRVPLSRVPGLDTVDFTRASLYAELDKRGAAPVRADYAVAAIAANETEAELLRVEVGSPLLLALTTAYDAADRVVEKGRMAYRGDRYQFRASLTR
jgi:GntR family transcriptional regulator